ncbi:MAG: hypothetical protein IIA03_00490 [Proteobacteria bacterium]|nr:hypothetical protein [Burkholderiaceae bacterium]MCH8854745.1 hypothetical protein [Pseudomonadota bacterium]
MQTTVPIEVSASTYAKLQKLAVLAGSEAAAIAKLIEHWEAVHTLPPVATPTRAAHPTAGLRIETWRTPNGDELPVGAPLYAPYMGKTYEALVVKGGIQYDGKVYDSPTSAGRAVKKKVRGLTGSAASTNGREFWRLRDPSTGQLVAIKHLNPGPPIDADELLREIMGTGSSISAA